MNNFYYDSVELCILILIQEIMNGGCDWQKNKRKWIWKGSLGTHGQHLTPVTGSNKIFVGSLLQQHMEQYVGILDLMMIRVPCQQKKN